MKSQTTDSDDPNVRHDEKSRHTMKKFVLTGEDEAYTTRVYQQLTAYRNELNGHSYFIDNVRNHIRDVYATPDDNADTIEDKAFERLAEWDEGIWPASKKIVYDQALGDRCAYHALNGNEVPGNKLNLLDETHYDMVFFIESPNKNPGRLESLLSLYGRNGAKLFYVKNEDPVGYIREKITNS